MIVKIPAKKSLNFFSCELLDDWRSSGSSDDIQEADKILLRSYSEETDMLSSDRFIEIANIQFNYKCQCKQVSQLLGDLMEPLGVSG